MQYLTFRSDVADASHRVASRHTTSEYTPSDSDYYWRNKKKNPTPHFPLIALITNGLTVEWFQGNEEHSRRPISYAVVLKFIIRSAHQCRFETFSCAAAPLPVVHPFDCNTVHPSSVASSLWNSHPNLCLKDIINSNSWTLCHRKGKRMILAEVIPRKSALRAAIDRPNEMGSTTFRCDGEPANADDLPENEITN